MSSNKFIARNGLAVGTTPVEIVDSTGTILVNAPTATKLQTARTISLSGDVAGSVSFDGSGDATITTTIQADSVTLGTDTTGNYMVNVAAGTGVSVSHTQGEGSTATVSIGQAVGTTDNVTFNNVTVNGTLTSDDITSTNISVAGNATITGNLTVSGTTTTVNSTTVAIADLNLELAKNATTAAQANGAGITVDGPATPATFTYTSADDRWNLNKDLNINRVYGNLTGAVTGNASTASAWQTARTLSFTGDATGSMSVDGSGNASTALTLAASGVTSGTYNNVTVNAKGLVTSGSNVSYLTSYSETDTLATVTARGASTSTAITIGNKLTLNPTGVNQSVSGMDVNISGTGTYQRGIRVLNSGMAATDSLIGVQVGSADSNKNAGQLYFYYAGAASTSNRLSMGLHSVDNVFNIFGSGNIMIGTTTDNGYKLNVSGTLNATGTITQNGTAVSLVGHTHSYLSAESDTLATVTARGNTTSTSIEVDYITTTNNGNGTNVRIGDDVWIGDVNTAYTMRIAGVSDNTKGYIIFGNGDSTALGRSGTGALTYGGNTVYHSGNLTNLNQLTNGPGYLTGESDTLATVTSRGASTSTASTFSGGLTVTGLTVAKSGTDSVITFPAQTNDPAYIKHYESNNTAIMYFNASDDTNDYFHFGYTGNPSTFQLRTDGVVTAGTWQASSISTSYTDAKVTSVSGTAPISVSPTTGATVVSHNTSGVTAGTYNNVTVDTYGHVTGGSNTAYLTSYSETSTLANVTSRGFITRSSSGSFAVGDQATPGLEIYGAGSSEPAFMTFHRPGVYAVKFGLDGSDLKVGGWSMGAVAYKIWHEGNDGSGSGLDADLLDGNHASAFALSGHNHTYNVNNDWLRENGDDAQFKIYGNSRSIIYRTDGVTNEHGGGGYPHIWYYGGSADSDRRMILNTSGQLWCSNYGWLHDAFAAASHTHSYLTGNQTITLSGDVSGSGTTSISVTVNQIDGWGFANTGSNNAVNANTLDQNGITYYTSGVDNFSGNSTDGALYSQYYSSSWQHQIAGDYREGNIAVRGKNNGTWSRWKPVPTITISDTAPGNETRGDLWWESDTGKLKIWYADGNTEQWVDAMPIPDTSTFFSKAGGAITGPTVISSSLTVNGNMYVGDSSSQSQISGWSTDWRSIKVKNLHDTDESAIGLYDNGDNWCGTFYGNRGTQGFLNSSSGWAFQVDNSGNAKVFGTDLTVGNTTSSNIYMTDTDETTRRIHCNSGRIGFLNSSNGWGAYCDNSGNWYANNLSGTNTGDQTNISGYAAYVTGNNTSTIGKIYFYGVGGNSGQGNDSYAIYQEGGSWSSPYPDLAIGYHTGIKIGAYYGYNGTRIYNNADFATQIASFGDGDNHFRSYYNVIAYASDKRLKTNITKIVDPISKVKAINGVTFDWDIEKVESLGFTPDKQHEVGVLAQEIEAVLPEAVEIAPFDYDWKQPDQSKSGDKYLTVKYEKIVPLLIEAIKAQQDQIDELRQMLKEYKK